MVNNRTLFPYHASIKEKSLNFTELYVNIKELIYKSTENFDHSVRLLVFFSL